MRVATEKLNQNITTPTLIPERMRLASSSVMASVGRLPPLGYSPQSAAVTSEIATIASMPCSREIDCRLAILRDLIEPLKEEVDRNLSWFNQLVKSVD